jgi:hypothetical protein
LLVCIRLFAAAVLACAPCAAAQLGAAWTPGFANPAPFPQEPFPPTPTTSVVSFDSGDGEQPWVTGRARIPSGPTFGQVQRWTGTQWEVLDTIPGQFEVSTLLRVADLGGGPQLYELRHATQTCSVRVWTSGGWSQVGATLATFAGRDLVAHDDGTGPALYLVGSDLSVPSLGSRVLRFDGANWVQLGPNLPLGVLSMLSFDDGAGARLYIGGSSATSIPSHVLQWNGTSWTSVGALLESVSQLASLDSGTGPRLYASTTSSPPTAQVLHVLSGGTWTPATTEIGSVLTMVRADLGAGERLHLFGYFGGTTVNPGGRVFDGTTLTHYPTPLVTFGAVQHAALVVAPDGSRRLALGGSFTRVNQRLCTGFAYWDGQDAAPIGHGFNGRVYALGSIPNGNARRLVAGSQPLRAGGTTSNSESHLWLQNGGEFEPMNEPNGLDDVLTLGSVDFGAGEVLFCGRYVASSFTSALMRWTGTSWVSANFSGTVDALLAFDSGSGNRLIIGGNFTAPGNRIAAYDGTSYSTLGSGMDNIVATLARHDEGAGERLFAGGLFTTAGGASANRVARWDGATWTALGSGIASGGLNALCSYAAELYAGGTFTDAGGTLVSNLARWNGNAWSDVPGGGANGSVLALCVHDDGRGPALYAAGGFSMIGGITAFNIARFDGQTWEPVDGGVDNVVIDLASIDDDGDGDAELFAAGDFLNAGTIASSRIARLAGRPHYTSFCFGDGSLADHTTPCPCGNDGAPGHGCASAANADGALLAASGSTQQGTVVLDATAMPASAFGLYLQHDAPDDRVFHDGVLCAGGNLLRLRNRNASGGASQFPDPTFAQDATLTLAQRGLVTPGSGALRYYSVFYRSPAATFCPPATANVTNGVRVIW